MKIRMLALAGVAAAVLSAPAHAATEGWYLGLGGGYAGYYPLENEQALAGLLHRAESDDDYLRRLARQCRARKPLTRYARERNALAALLREAAR